MGKFTGDAGVTGVVGTVVISSWKGIKYMKARGHVSKKPPTEMQLQQQAKISLVSKFVYSMKALLEKSFIGYAVKKTGTNAAFSYNFKNCIAGAYPALLIDYSLALVSRGDLPNATDVVATAGAGGQVQFTWTDNTGTGQAKGSDKCIGVIHCAALNITMYSNGDETRQAGSLLLDAHQLTGKTIETWLVIIASNGADAANSVYTGQLVVG
ncbi:MAG: DUF6266 family protein [Ferruginibacter sp.]